MVRCTPIVAATVTPRLHDRACVRPLRRCGSIAQWDDATHRGVRGVYDVAGSFPGLGLRGRS
ncbi:hypothetical protein BD309DRAFT_974267 [Dichomitus squalens]|uniref:Uncharacterized protein n=1 Tax=Dichomitus squalens TaxID=114155 RepID=A0A4Q9N970_9APHY|nr:hypothetical protein BD309DRAFT_974267 [Dichomitus squalens]TBU52252.1 hypothetical protein BD310DRAFT_940608 [Dichomitus squalens]